MTPVAKRRPLPDIRAMTLEGPNKLNSTRTASLLKGSVPFACELSRNDTAI